MRNTFGWSMPPGAAGDPNAPWNQDDGPCAVCCAPADACICMECTTCGETGNPRCYVETAHEGHNLRLTRDQVISRQRARICQLELQVQDAELYLSYLETGGEFSDDITDNPDPFA